MTLAGAKIRALDAPSPRRVLTDLVTTDSPTTSGTTEMVTDTFVFDAVAGEQYEINHEAGWVHSVATDQFIVRVREDSLTGTQLDGGRMPVPGSTVGVKFRHRGFYTAVASDPKTIVITVARQAGSGTVKRAGSANTPCSITVDQIT